MDLLLLGLGMGIVGGLVPTPLHLIALTQATLDQWMRTTLLLVGPPMLVDGIFLVTTFFFYQYIPFGIAHYTAYAGGVALAAFGGFSLCNAPPNNPGETVHSWALTHRSVSVATLVEITAPGTWVYWLTIAGPIIAEGRQAGYWHVAPFFAGSLVGYYGSAFASVWLMAWGTGLHKKFNRHLFRVANILLLVLGALYFWRAYSGS
ncbi:MAG: hypothetical protein M1404_04660 [Acidobacteria bacterium]|nr:hypothetical protein [Acidobacteriota bacterium]